MTAALMAFALACAAQAAPVKVVVDTDLGTEDVRALAVLKSLAGVEVLAAVSSDGGMSPEDGARELELVFKGSPVGAGRSLGKRAPEWRRRRRPPEEPKGAPAGKPAALRPAAEVVREALLKGGGGATYVCLGPLTNLADALKADPGLKGLIKDVLYYGAPHFEIEEGTRMDWNTGRDNEAARAVLTSGLPVVALAQDRDEQAKFDSSLFDPIEASSRTSPGAQLIVAFHQGPGLRRMIREGRMRVGKEILPLYLAKPSLAVLGQASNSATVQSLKEWDNDGARKEYLRLLTEARGKK